MEHKHKHKGHMIDNRMVHDNHQEGIKRVIQKHHDPKDYCGHYGSMKNGWKHGHTTESHRAHAPDHFKRAGSPLTPRKA